MATHVPCKKNDTNGYVFYVSLVSQANTKTFQANPTLVAGDVKRAIDDAAPANLTTLPAVDADFTKRVKVTLSQAETNGDNITIIFSDAAGAEWCDLTVNIQTAAQTLDEMDTNIDDIEADTNELQGLISASKIAAQVKGIDNIDLSATMKTSVNAEVVDCLGTDTLAELSQGIPAKNPTHRAALMLLYMALRNQLTTTSSELGIYNDTGTKIAKKALSDDATTYTEGKMASGA